MATKSFGRRGLAPQGTGTARGFATSPTFQERNAATNRAALPPDDVDGGDLFLAHLPLLTGGLIIALFFIFAVEQRFAFDADAKGGLSVLSLTAFGAASYDLVIGAGEIWRPFLAPLLHASFSHFVGNSIALFFIGLRLEPLIGRSWFAAIFVASALGGLAGSLLGNPHGVVTVGASGAITGLLGALFAVSFNHRAARHDRRAMRLTALRFGIPALAPLLFVATGHTDYHAHLGGAIVGSGVALGLCAIWSEGRFRPDFTGLAASVSLAGLAGSVIASFVAIHGFPTYRGEAVDLIPSAERPKTFRAGDTQSATLLARYPKDPLSHVIRAVFLADAQRAFAAEMELRSAMALAGQDLQGRTTGDLARAILALVIADEGRREEARGIVGDFCRGSGPEQSQRMVRKAKLCD